jgi:hypothetical protein
MMVVAAVEGPAVVEKSGKGSLEIIRNETSTIVSELKDNKLSLLMNGIFDINQQIPLHMQDFLKKRVPLIRDVGTLEIEVEKMVHAETKESVKEYLERNGLRKLTKAEREEVLEYEGEMNEKFI